MTRRNRERGRRPLLSGLMVALGSLFPLAAAHAGAWTLPKGSGQAIVSGLYAEADEGFDGGGGAVAFPRFRKGEVSVYGEYGLFDGFTVVAEGSVSSSAFGDPFSLDEARWGLGALGGRFRLWEGGGGIVSAEVTARLSPSDSDTAARMPLEAEGEVRIMAGHGFRLRDMAAFADAQLAYRFGVPLEAAVFDRSDDVRLDVTLGIRPKPDWMVLTQSFNTFESDAGRPAAGDRRSQKMQLSLVHDLSASVSLQVGLLGTVAGADVLKERGLLTAMWLRF